MQKPNPHTTDVPDGSVNNGTVTSTNDNKNVISDGCKEKYLKNDVVGVHRVCVASSKSASSGGRKCGSSVTTVT